ncbi:hypothetical protein [Geminisphaera colitermitum]|uniref:hypothetical protein n=1 Tax=Geminisphaera colitermitum TaxID=1148786 RepID=UPI000158D5A6|nr:hypothetical protein [Geminisphaera colitermitum]
MDETPTEKPAEGGLNKIDLTQLQGFSFGTQWTDAGNRGSGSTGGGNRDHQRRDDRPRREGGATADPRRDRRSFRKSSGDAAPGAGQPADSRGPDSGAQGGERPPRQRREIRGGGQGGGNREGGHAGERGHGTYGGHGPRRDFRGGSPRREGGGAPIDRGPYINPNLSLTLYTEDAGFSALAKAVRASCRTYELFDIARVIVEKNDRFIALVQRKAPEPSRAPSAAAGESTAPTAPAKPAPFYISVPDGIPFDTEEAAIQHVITNHLGLFFQTIEAEIEPPKGNFQVINRCTVTGKLLGPPNYHRYTQIVQQHHAANIRMPFEAYRAKIETVRDPELINQWLEEMKKVTRYVWTPPVSKGKQAAAAKAAAAKATSAQTTAEPASAPPAAEDTDTPAPVEAEAGTAPVAESTPASPEPAAAPASVETPVAETEPGTPAEAEAAAAPATAEDAPAKPVISFDSLEEARNYLLTHARDRIIRATHQIRYPGRLLDKLPQGELRRSIEGYLEKQRRFPLDTANALRGRLRREGFTIFKKGSKGISYVCAVKRKFRVPGQAFADSIDALIRYIEAHPMVRQIDLPSKFLGIKFPAPAAKVPESAEVEAAAAGAPLPVAEPPPALSPEDQARLSRMQMDLRWLVGEGYVTEFRDGRLFAPAPMVEARKKEIEGAEHDPENFPEIPSSNTTPATPPSAAEETAGVGEEATPATAPDAPDATAEEQPATEETAPVAEAEEAETESSSSVASEPEPEPEPTPPQTQN